MEEKNIYEEDKNNFKISKVRTWQIISGVLFIALMISLFMGFKGGVTGNVISENEAGASLVSYLNAQTGGGVEFVSSADKGNLYEISVSYQGQNIPVYITKDGEYFIQEINPITGEVIKDNSIATSNSIVDINMETLIDDDAVKGDDNAPVIMVEFSDYECPYCGRHFEQTYSQIIQEYVDTGKVKLVFRDFPLSFHPNAQKAAEAAECAGEQNKYWEMHDKLFENQQALSVKDLKQYAKEIGLNTAKFNSCLDSGEMASEVSKDMQDGQAAGISGTPGFIINGQLASGAQPFSVFKQIIDQELNK
ncbi:MAG: thioredoxin domain-containing protein [Nanoarchaeota archaeon]